VLCVTHYVSYLVQISDCFKGFSDLSQSHPHNLHLCIQQHEHSPPRGEVLVFMECLCFQQCPVLLIPVYLALDCDTYGNVIGVVGGFPSFFRSPFSSIPFFISLFLSFICIMYILPTTGWVHAQGHNK
jgi:hypothetical protein